MTTFLRLAFLTTAFATCWALVAALTFCVIAAAKFGTAPMTGWLATAVPTAFCSCILGVALTIALYHVGDWWVNRRGG